MKVLDAVLDIVGPPMLVLRCAVKKGIREKGKSVKSIWATFGREVKGW